jgi:hypothetical protein
MWSFIFSAASWLLGLFGFGKPDPIKTGEKLGDQETQNTNAQAGLKETTDAVQARDANAAAIAANPDRLRDGSDPAARKYSDQPD